MEILWGVVDLWVDEKGSLLMVGINTYVGGSV
jgi:hypothetical protein